MNTPLELGKANAKIFCALALVALALIAFGISAIIQPRISDFWTICLFLLPRFLMAGAVIRLIT